MCKIITDIPVY